MGMRTIYCDKCGKEAEEENNITLYEPHRCTQSDGHRFTTQISYDLCDECLVKIINWIDNKEKENLYG